MAKENISLIRDNAAEGRVADFLEKHITKDSNVSIVSAFFTIYAYHELKSALDSIEHLRFLFGEPNFVKMDDTKNPKDFKITDDALQISGEDKLKQRTIAKECAEWIENKVEIRSLVRPNFLHGKLYSIKKANDSRAAISGSSNFTTKGLGLSKSNNMELNLIVDSEREKEELQEWFDNLWNNALLVEDVKDEVLRYLRQVYAELPPERVYFKTLYTLFGSSVLSYDDDTFFADDKKFLNSKIWNTLYDFQKAGVKGAIDKIKNYNGCIIADSVGLGKTYEALAVIKYFESKYYHYRVLVLCPKKLSSNWTLYQASQNNALNPLKEDALNYDVLYHTDMGRTRGVNGTGQSFEHFDWDAYDMVVIDESHNFRGDPMAKEIVDENGNTCIKLNRAAWLMDKVLKAGKDTKVLLLSATPVNNNLSDLRNQINLITQGAQDALFDRGIKSIETSISNAQRQFTLWANGGVKKRKTASKARGQGQGALFEQVGGDEPRNKERDLMAALDSSFFVIMDALTIARSRRQITSSYDTNAIGSFPKRLRPINLSTKIDSEDEFPSYSSVDRSISGYSLSLFNPTKYVLSGHEKKYINSKYEALSQSYREQSLIGMMKINYMKRLESSVHSFSVSLLNTIEKIKRLEKKIHAYQKTLISADEELDALDELDETDESGEAFEVGRGLKFNLEDIDCGKWLADLKNDRDALLSLQCMAERVTPERDMKLSLLKKTIKQRAEKTIVFTAYANTAQYLYDNLKDWALKELRFNTAIVTGTEAASNTGCTSFERVLLNFAPIAKNRQQAGASWNKGKEAEDIDLLIATDCISEGQNLQDCAFLVNYDIHWNPVRIIQRFGRIDRIGSKKETIQMANFWPTDDLDGYLNLKNRVVTRMALVNVAATGGDNVLTPDEDEAQEKNYRDKQLERLKEEALELEDLDDSVSLTDFTLDSFRADLSAFLKENERMLQSMSDGAYAVVKGTAALPAGAIFCLKEGEDKARDSKVNPLSPYLLVYVLESGEVKYTFMHARETLEAFRALCAGKKDADKDLCNAFNDETKDGKDVSKYFYLLKQAISSSNEETKRRGAALLTSSRDGMLLGRRSSAKADAAEERQELITWLVIK